MSERQRMQAKMSNNQARQHGDVLAQLLDETNAKHILTRIIQYFGLTWTQDCLKATQQAQTDGGLFRADGVTQRTLGGIFLYLAKQEMTEDQKWFIFKFPKQEIKAKKAKPTQNNQKAS